MIRKLLSLPPNLVDCFHELENASREEWFCTSDPVGSKLGSGGGTTWLLEACRENEDNTTESTEWLAREKRILLHAGGQSRRLPGYAPSGKILTPIPVFRWERGQRLGQKLLDLQLPLYERIMNLAPDSMHTLIASGDVYIRSEKRCNPFPKPMWFVTVFGWSLHWLLITGYLFQTASIRTPSTLCCRSRRSRSSDRLPRRTSFLWILASGCSATVLLNFL